MTDRALCRHHKAVFPSRQFGRAALGQRTQHLRNHIARPAYDHPVTGTQILAPDLVFVMQGGIADRCSPDKYGLQTRDRRQRAGTPDLYFNGEQASQCFFGGELVRNRVARRTSDKTGFGLQRAIVELVDNAIDIKR